MRNEKQLPLISIIIAVYNVENYVSQCIESVAAQTYSNLEILIMEGKSTDNSLKICREWEKKDSRITVVSRKDGGLGPARNYGISIANGEYLFFVDSDDYLPERAIEMLWLEVTDEQVDLVAGGFEIINEEGSIADIITPIRYGCNEIIQNIQEKKFYIRRGIIAVWGKLYRTSLWKRTGLAMPAGAAEDMAVFPSIVVAANKIICCDFVVYEYRKGGQNSLSDDARNYGEVYKVVDCYANWIKLQGKFLDYYNSLLFFSKREILNSLNRLEETIDDKEIYHREFENVFYSKLKEHFGSDCLEDKLLLFPIGSYNTRWICNKAQPKSNKNHVAFTSTVSQFFNDNKPLVCFQTESAFRQRALLDDCEKAVKSRLRKMSDTIDYVALDFMNDIYNAVELENGAVLAQSEVYDEAKKGDVSIERIVKWSSTEYFEMWKAACRHLCKLLKNINCEVILLQTRYVERYYDGYLFRKFDNCKDIQEKNEKLESMEKFFLENCKNYVHIVPLSENAKYADVHFAYGCRSDYLCYKAQIQMVEGIFDAMGLS